MSDVAILVICVFRNSKGSPLDLLEVMGIYVFIRICDFYTERKNNKLEYLTLSCITRWCLLQKVQSLESQPRNVRLCLLSP